MKKDEITAIFDKQASTYDEKWSKTAPIKNALHLLIGTVLSELPPDARILCVGSGTGSEILYLAEKFPGWRFTAVEPSAPMLEVFQSRMEAQGLASRCELHCGYVESLQPGARFDAATSILVSQFILERQERAEFFRGIADRLLPEGVLITADLTGDLRNPVCQSLLEVWFRLTNTDGTLEGLEKLKEAYTKDVAVLPPREVCDIISLGGFETPVQFYQAGLIGAWFANRLSDLSRSA